MQRSAYECKNVMDQLLVLEYMQINIKEIPWFKQLFDYIFYGRHQYYALDCRD